MFEVEIYARGLRETGTILELDRQLVEIAGLRYKMDANHDIVYLEFDEPTLSIREIRTIFLNLGLEPLLSARFRPELQSRTKTERLSAFSDVIGDSWSEQKRCAARSLAVHSSSYLSSLLP